MRTVAAVIASFEPGPELVKSVEAVVGQVESVYVVDDGSPSLNGPTADRVRAHLDACASLGAHVLGTPMNSGIGHALNRGVRAALASGADAILTLDQDSVIDDDYVASVTVHLDLAASVGIDDALASPATINGEVAPFWFAHQGLTLAFEPLQSGLVITRSVFEKAGLFEEGLFIDCVDTEFYLRARAHGAHALIVPGTDIRHRLGRPARWTPPRPVRKLLRGRPAGAAIEFSEDAPFRHYYIARNRLALYRRYGGAEKLWVTASVLKDSFVRGRAMLIGSERVSRTYFTVAGVRAAVRGETGRIPSRTVLRGERLRPRRVTTPEARVGAERAAPELVSVIIPVRDGVDVIDTQLDALGAQTYQRPFEVIIADNGSRDGLREHIEHHPLRERLSLAWVDASARGGGSFARNAGAHAAAGDFYAFCDGDDRVYPQWLEHMTAAAMRYDAVGGAVETHSLNSADAQSWRDMLPPETPYEFPGFLPVSPTCNFGVWADMFAKVNGFDVEYDRGAEDSDFAIRVQLAGGVLGHAPQALVAYRLRDTLPGIWSQSVMCGEGDAQLYSDYRAYGLPRRPWYGTVDVVLYLVLRNPLLPTAITRVPTGRWLFHAGNLVGRIKGSIRHRAYYV
ncbi:glycosyltransferase [Gordonia sp. HNM0687]|uniref:Glycosyltransferase n=1 Tax=Gordonia mangrovi TaxID=2665643 RepID=A0A6L7GK73_9ACTN|nr:glycosyltransferase [Gordonia mangrovi]MXP19847.1 glycosyltransferase [Gordonia mangrovi]UVF79529.1 glycosyltransferase [Gordonia mangrovi]